MYTFHRMAFPNGKIANAIKFLNRSASTSDEAERMLLTVSSSYASQLRREGRHNVRNIRQGPYSRVIISKDSYGTDYKTEIFTMQD